MVNKYRYCVSTNVKVICFGDFFSNYHTYNLMPILHDISDNYNLIIIRLIYFKCWAVIVLNLKLYNKISKKILLNGVNEGDVARYNNNMWAQNNGTLTTECREMLFVEMQTTLTIWPLTSSRERTILDHGRTRRTAKAKSTGWTAFVTSDKRARKGTTRNRAADDSHAVSKKFKNATLVPDPKRHMVLSPRVVEKHKTVAKYTSILR